MLSYRVLNSYDCRNYNENGTFESKNKMSRQRKIIDALKIINSHLQNGSKKPTPWLSTSISLTTAMELYAIPFSEYNCHRPSVAVLNNLTETTSGLNKDDIIGDKQIIINLSDRKHNLDAYCKGLLYKTNGAPCILRNKEFVASMGYHYAINAQEVIVFNEILNNNIVRVLNALESDIVYAVAKYYEENKLPNKDEVIYDLVNNVLDKLSSFDMETLSYYNLKPAYMKIYSENSYICNVANALFKCVPYSFDILDIYAYLRSEKREIIGIFLKELGYNLSYVPIVDDKIQIVRVGECGQYRCKTNEVFRNCELPPDLKFAEDIILPNLESKADMDLSISNLYIYKYLYNYGDTQYTLYAQRGMDVITNIKQELPAYDKVKKLEYTDIPH